MRATILAFPFLLLVACGGGEQKAEAPATPPPPPAPAAPAMDPAVAQAVDLHASISADPTKADAVLASKNVTREQLDDLMYRIAADPQLAAAYEKAVAK